MKELLDNVKILIPIGALIVALAGFYYTTQYRLDILESKISELEAQDKKIKKLITRKEK